MTSDEIRAFFQRQQAAWRARDAEQLAAGHAQDGVLISPIFRTVTGAPAILESYKSLFRIFPDWDYRAELLLIDGAHVAEPFTVSATHVAYSSIRVEPTWMMLGQSAGIAAALAAKQEVAVQQLPYDSLRERLLAQGQVLELPVLPELPPMPTSTAVDPASLPGIVLDDAQAELTGAWTPMTSPVAISLPSGEGLVTLRSTDPLLSPTNYRARVGTNTVTVIGAFGQALGGNEFPTATGMIWAQTPHGSRSV